jgi:hypothetical protein
VKTNTFHLFVVVTPDGWTFGRKGGGASEGEAVEEGGEMSGRGTGRVECRHSAKEGILIHTYKKNAGESTKKNQVYSRKRID